MSYYGLWAYGIPALVNSSVGLNSSLFDAHRGAGASLRPAGTLVRGDNGSGRTVSQTLGVRIDYGLALPFGNERLQMPVVTMADWYRQRYPDRYRGKNYNSPLRLYELPDTNTDPQEVDSLGTAESLAK